MLNPARKVHQFCNFFLYYTARIFASYLPLEPIAYAAFLHLLTLNHERRVKIEKLY